MQEADGITISADSIYNAVIKKDEVFSKLEKFNLLAEQYYREECQQDIVLEYLQLSGGCQEIMNLIKDMPNTPAKDAVVLLNLLTSILIRTANDLKLYSSVGFSIVKEFLNYGIRIVFNFIKPAQSKPSRIKAVLHLLTAMIAQGPQAALSVFTKFSFSSPDFVRLFSKSNPMEEEDVRAAFVNVILLLLTIGDNDVVRQLVETKGFLNGIFPWIMYDKSPVILLILKTFSSKIVENPSIGKTSKIRLFNDFSMKYVLKLYAWTGPVRVKKSLKRKLGDDDELTKPLEVPEEEIASVREATHEFMMSLCCSYKNGIIFRDFTIGTSGRNQNHVITNILKSFPSPYSNQHMSEFIIAVLKTCPDQVKFFLPVLKDSLEPRISVPWLQSISLLKKIISSQDYITCLFKSGEKKPMSKLLAISKALCIPDIISITQLSEALKESHPYICHHLLDYLSIIFHQAHLILLFCKSSGSDSLYSASELNEFSQSFRISVANAFPLTENLQSYWHKLSSSQWRSNYDEVTTALISINQDLQAPSLASQIGKFFEILRSYKEISPDSLSNTEIPFFQLLTGLKDCENNLTCDELCMLQLQVIDFISSQDPQGYSIWNKNKQESPVMAVLQVYLMTEEPKIISSASKTMCKILAHTRLFDNCKWEMEVWLKEMKRVAKKCHPVLVKFLSESLQSLDKNFPQSPLNNEFAIEKSDPKVEYLSGTNSKFENGKLKRHCFSNLVPATLNCLNSLSEDDKKVCSRYVGSVLRHVLHHQLEPETLFDIIKENKSLFNASLYDYWDTLCCIKNRKKFKGFNMKIRRGKKALNFSEELEDAFISFHLRTEKVTSDSSSSDDDDFKQLSCKIKTVCCEEVVDIAWQLLMYIDMETKILAVDDMHKTSILIYADMITELISTEIKYFKVILENETNGVSSEEPTSISVLKPTVLKDVLSHPSIINNFLEMQSKHALTNFVFDIAHLKLNGIYDIENKYFNSFKDKALTFCQLYIIPNVTEENPSPSILEIFHRIIDLFASLFSANDAENLIELLTAVNEKCLQLLDPKFSVVSTLLGICNKEQEFSLLPPHLIRSLFAKFIRYNGKKSKTILRRNILQFFRKHPVYSFALDGEDILFALDQESNEDLAILDLFIASNPKHKNSIQQAVLTSIDNSKNWNQEFIMHVINTCVKAQCDSEDQDVLFLQPIADLYWSNLRNNLKYDLSSELQLPLGSDINYVLGLFMSKKFLVEKKITKFLKKFCKKADLEIPSPTKVNLLLEIISCWKDHAPSDASLLVYEMLLKVIIQWITAIPLNEQTEGKFQYQNLVDFAVTVTKIVEDNQMQQVFNDQQWLPFVQKILKSALRSVTIGGDLLTLLKVLCEKMYKSAENTKLIEVKNIYSLLTSHSTFFPILLDSSQQYFNLKSNVIDLLITLVQLNSEVCKDSHITLFLASYNATMSCVDEKLLRLIKLYEDSGISMLNFSPFIWGKSAIAHYAVKKNIKLFLWKQPKMHEVLSLFQGEILDLTALNFPLHLKLEPMLSSDFSLQNLDIMMHQIYDPRFVLPLISTLLSPGAYVHCNSFIDSKVLSVVFASLSSYDPSMRSLGYYCLAQFYAHLESSMYGQRLIWISLLDSVRFSIEIPNARIPCIITIFLAKLVSILSKPDSFLYTALYKFLTVKPTLDLGHVPEFYKLFNSIEIQHRMQRSWILGLIGEGIRTSLDFHLCQKRYIFTILLPFYSSSVCVQHDKVKILQILSAAVKIYSSARTLCQSGLLPWLHSAIKQSDENEGEILKNINFIMKSLLATSSHTYTHGDSGYKEKGVKDVLGSQPLHDVGEDCREVDVNENCLSEGTTESKNLKGRLIYSSFPCEFLLVHLSMLEKISSFDVKTLQNYLRTLVEALNFLSTTTETKTALEERNQPSSILFSHVLYLYKKWNATNEKFCNETELKNDPSTSTKPLQQCTNEVHALFTEIIMFWKPKWDKMNENQYSTMLTHFIAILHLMLNSYLKNGEPIPMALSEWLYNCIETDSKHGVIQTLLSSEEKAKSCFELIWHLFERSLLSQNIYACSKNNERTSYNWTHIIRTLKGGISEDLASLPSSLLLGTLDMFSLN